MHSKEPPGVHSATRQMLAFALLCLPALFGPAAAADDLCGTTVFENVKLEQDLICAGDGIAVGADGIKVDLNGRTIEGPGVGAGGVEFVGIRVTGRTGVSISGGTVRNFDAGVRVRESADVVVKKSTDIVVKNMEFVENGDGVDLQRGSEGNTIKENAFRDNVTRGIMLRSFSIDNVVKENTFTGNRVGILVFGGTDSTVKENVVSASVVAGIRINVIATGNVILENTVTANPAGIEFLVTPTGSATGNTVAENLLATNTCGLKGPTAGNTLRENVFEGNAADSCP